MPTLVELTPGFGSYGPESGAYRAVGSTEAYDGLEGLGAEGDAAPKTDWTSWAVVIGGTGLVILIAWAMVRGSMGAFAGIDDCAFGFENC